MKHIFIKIYIEINIAAFVVVPTHVVCGCAQAKQKIQNTKQRANKTSATAATMLCVLWKPVMWFLLIGGSS